MKVVDASAFARALVEDGADAAPLRRALRSHHIALPEYATVEIVSVVRGRVLGGLLTAVRAGDALADLAVAPVHRYDTRPLLPRIWELRDNLTTYDAGYVALAEVLDCPLVTADRRLAGAPGIRCDVETV